MRRRTYATATGPRGPIPDRLLFPVLRDFVTDDEWRTTNGQSAGARLATIAEPRYRAEVADFYRDWTGPWDDAAPVAVGSFEEAQRAASVDSEEARVMKFCTRVAAGWPVRWQPRPGSV